MLAFRLDHPTTEPTTLLVLGAHSDDIEIGAGGTVLRLCAERPKLEVVWVVLSAHGAREEEARASAAAFLEHAATDTVIVQQFRESYFPYVGSEVKDFFEELRSSVNPHLVLTHARDDLHQDHRLVNELTWNTFRDHQVLEYEIPKFDGDLGRPNVFVPLDEKTCERKIELLLRHFESQRARPWFTADLFWATLRLRGVECKSPSGYAEAFYGRKVVL